MTNLFQYLTQDFDEEDMTWDDEAKVVTTKLEIHKRQPLDARIADAIDVTQHDEFWCQTCGTGYYEAGRCVYCGADEPLPFA